MFIIFSVHFLTTERSFRQTFFRIMHKLSATDFGQPRFPSSGRWRQFIPFLLSTLWRKPMITNQSVLKWKRHDKRGQRWFIEDLKCWSKWVVDQVRMIFWPSRLVYPRVVWSCTKCDNRAQNHCHHFDGISMSNHLNTSLSSPVWTTRFEGRGSHGDHGGTR